MTRRALALVSLAALCTGAAGVVVGQSLAPETVTVAPVTAHVTQPVGEPVDAHVPGGDVAPDAIMAALSTPCGIAADCFDAVSLHVDGHVFPLDTISQSLATETVVTNTETVTEYVDVPVPSLVYVPTECPSLDETADAWFQNGLDAGYDNGYADALDWVAATAPESAPTEAGQ